MGLKSGSRDAGFDEADDKEAEPVDQRTAKTGEPDSASKEANQETATRSEESSTADSGLQPERAGQRHSMNSIPYKLRRNKVNEGREQVPYFLREEIINAEGELQDTLEEMLGETVYKSDYREAAMVVAQRNPEFVAEVLREWGYDLEV
jgi:hypothetical protein